MKSNLKTKAFKRPKDLCEFYMNNDLEIVKIVFDSNSDFHVLYYFELNL